MRVHSKKIDVSLDKTTGITLDVSNLGFYIELKDTIYIYNNISNDIVLMINVLISL